MKKSNWSVVKFLVYVILGISAIAFVNTNSEETQANQPKSVTKTTTPYSQNPHKIELTLNQLDELKVTERQRVDVGDIISSRTSTKAKLQSKKERLEAAIKKASLPLNQLKPIPIPNFQTELASLKQAQFNLDVIVREIEKFDSQLHFKDSFYSSVFESDKIQKLAELKRKELAASINLEKAIASLDEAKLNYQKQQYEHSLKISHYQASLQEQQKQVNSLQLKLDKVNDDLENLVAVSSPYAGKVKKIQILRQSDRNINVEVTLDVIRK